MASTAFAVTTACISGSKKHTVLRPAFLAWYMARSACLSSSLTVQGARPNKVTLAATKRIQGERLADGADVQLKVVIGEGNVGGGHVMIDVPLVETARTAADIEDRTEEFVVDAR